MSSRSLKHRKSVTIKDIAKKAGVSQRSVSQALLPGNGKVKVSEETRQRIRAIAKAMGYRANTFARSLRTGESGMIGVLCFPNIQYLGAYRLTHCVRDIEQQGFTPFVYHLERHTKERFEHACNVMIDTRVDAVLVLQPLSSFREKYIDMLLDAGLPVTTLGGRPFRNVTSFLTDKVGAFEMATNHLIEIGCTDLALLTTVLPDGPNKREFHHSRCAQEGFSKAVHASRRAGATISARLHQLDLETAAQNTPTFPHIHGVHAPGYIAIREMAKNNNLPRGLVCQTDQWALGALQACAELNIRVPDDIAVTGFDNMPSSSTGPIPLTTIAESLEELSNAAIRHLVNPSRSDNKMEPARHSLMPATLIQRRSTTLTPPRPPAIPKLGTVVVPI